MNYFKSVAILVSCAALSSASFAISISIVDNPTNLGNTILGTGVTLNSATWISHAPGSTGTFTGGGASGLGINSGIVLTTGSAAIAGQGQTSGSAGQDNGIAGWTPLDALIPGYSTFDAAVLKLDFTTTANNLFFNYVFGSEEYNEWVGSPYNDVFGFFLDGMTLANNLALIPSTTTPVSINDVNLALNPAYYRNNENSQVSPTLEYDGLTTVLTAKALNIGAGNHTIYLAIADAGDHIYDSGVFIQGSSFSTEETESDVPDSGATLAMLGIALAGLCALRRRIC